MKDRIIALVDCNNFYASCEKVFDPSLENKAVVVLSNNDGCVISRSDEARNLGIKMGIPFFELDKSITSQIRYFSANYPLYGDFSFRIMDCLSKFAPDFEIYSIDEAFLDLTGMPVRDHNEYIRNIRQTVMQWTGIPVTISLAPNKTLAKAGNYIAKKNKSLEGTWNFFEQVDKYSFLKNIPVDEIWGIGDQYARLFNGHSIYTAFDLKQADPFFTRKMTNVMVQRIISELNGIACYFLNSNPAVKKEICISRSFGKKLTSLDELTEATSNFAAHVGEKLRAGKACTRSLIVFVMTARFTREPRYANYSIIRTDQATNDTQMLIRATSKALKELYKPGYKYKKSGVIANDIIPEDAVQQSLFSLPDPPKGQRLGDLVDGINRKQGKGKIRFAIQGFNDNWKNKQEKLSFQYTTKWNEILNVMMEPATNIL